MCFLLPIGPRLWNFQCGFAFLRVPSLTGQLFELEEIDPSANPGRRMATEGRREACRVEAGGRLSHESTFAGPT